jgi:micrococcal nuclease
MKTKYFYNAKVIKVVDGDTLDLLIDLGFGSFRKERIRLAGPDCKGFNAPEVRGEEKEEGLKAKDILIEKFNLNPNVVIETFQGKGKYGRYIASVFAGKDLATYLVESGLGEWKEY